MNATIKRPAPSITEQLVPLIEVSEKDDVLVDARQLHKSLKVKQDFRNWINYRINEWDFIENQDYVSFGGKFPVIGRKAKQYHLTIDMAKELAMLERTAVGKAIRRYFIAAEKELKGKRLYGQVATMTDLKKKVPTMSFNGRVLFQYRRLQEELGYSTKSSLSNVKKLYDSQICVINRTAYVSEEYAKLMISRATARKIANETKEAPVLMPSDFGQIKLGL